MKLHKSGHTSLEESYSIYSAVLAADKIDFVENEKFETVEPNTIDNHIEDKPKTDKIKRTKKSKVKEDVGVVDISDIIVS